MVLAQNTFPPIGLWREHLPYQGSMGVTASANKVYSATPYSLFSVDLATKEISRYSKVSGLSETAINTISFDLLSQKLYVAYSNSNIDVIDANGIHNIPDLKRENISGDKNIYQVYPDNNRAYLSTGLGVIVLDAEKMEIKDSWFIGNNGGNVKVNAFVKNNNFFYAATEEGLKKISSSSNPADFTNWQNISGTSGLSNTAAKSVVALNGKTIVLQNDSLFIENGTSWSLFFANGWPTFSINTSDNKLFVAQRQTNGTAQMLILDAAGAVIRTMQNPGLISYPKNGISINNELWIAD